MGNVRAIGQALFGDERLAQALYCFNPVERASGRDLFMSTEIHPVDQILPAPRLLALGLQHVLVMYAGAVAVPLIIGRALKLPLPAALPRWCNVSAFQGSAFGSPS